MQGLRLYLILSSKLKALMASMSYQRQQELPVVLIDTSRTRHFIKTLNQVSFVSPVRITCQDVNGKTEDSNENKACQIICDVMALYNTGLLMVKLRVRTVGLF